MVVCQSETRPPTSLSIVQLGASAGEKMTNRVRWSRRCPPLSPNPFTLSRPSGGRGIVSLVFSLEPRASQRSLHLRTELESDKQQQLATGSAAGISSHLTTDRRGWLMAARSPLQQRSSESSISDRDRTRTSSGSTRVHLARRLTGQVHVGSMEVPPDVVGIDKGMVTVAVKVRPLTLDSERNGGGGLHTWQEWRAVQKLLSTVHEPTDRSVLEGRRYLIRYYATSVESESFRLIMEFCPHRDLFSELESRGALGPEPRERVPQQEARRWVLQLAKGLRYLHEKKIAHRDLCPQNILLGPNREAKICNFGASTIRATEPTRERVVGNLHYTAPEAVSGTWYDPKRADVWSLGAVFFFLLTGSPLLQLPYPECRGFELVKAVGCKGVLKLWNMDRNFSAATMDLLAKMLTVDPARRLGSMKEVLEHPAMLATARTERSLIAVER